MVSNTTEKKMATLLTEDPKYLIPKVNQIQLLNTQIFEAQQIITRNLMELEEFVVNGERSRIKEVEENNKLLKEKIDGFRALLFKLDKEAYEASGHPAL